MPPPDSSPSVRALAATAALPWRAPTVPAVTVRLSALALVLLAGCLPSSGKRQDQALLPADSTSRALAQEAPVDTLRRVWRAEAPAADPLALPTSLAWAGERLAVVDTPAGRVRWLRPDGRFAGSVELGAEAFPYAAGAVGDTLGVLLRGAGEVTWLAGSEVVRRAPVPESATAALVTDDGAWVRLGGGLTGAPGEVARLGTTGAERARRPIGGPSWRAVGFLTAWGDSLLALSGYRPVVDVWAPGGTGALDTLALAGFDSPQLRRSAQFVRGDADEPPLLAPSARALGDRLFVLNARADELRVDVYGRDGRLERVLVNEGTRGPLDLVAVDLAVRRREGAVELAVLWQRPRGLLRAAGSAVELWRWGQAPAGTAARAEGRR